MILLVDHQIGFRREGKTLEIVPAAHVVQPVAIEGVRSAHRLQPRLQGAKLMLPNLIDRARRTGHHAGGDQPTSYEIYSRRSPRSHQRLATLRHAAIFSARRC